MAITELQQDLFILTYCTNYDVYATSITYDFNVEKSQGTLSDPRVINSLPYPVAIEKICPAELSRHTLSHEWVFATAYESTESF